MNDMVCLFTRLWRSPIPRRVVALLVLLAWSSLAYGGEIHEAAREGDLAKVKALLKGNPDLVFSKDVNGWTPLHWAVDWEHKDIAELLLANRAKVNAKDRWGWTSLHYAAISGYRDVAELLLANKAEVNDKDADSWTPELQRGSAHPIVEPLPPANMNAEEKGGQTPLHKAAMLGRKDVAELLLAYKAEVNAKDANGWTPLHYAAQRGYRDVAALLLVNGAVVNAKDNYGWTAMHDAALRGQKDVVELLLANKADVNAKDHNGETPLHKAVAEGPKGVAELPRKYVAALLRQHGGHE